MTRPERSARRTRRTPAEPAAGRRRRQDRPQRERPHSPGADDARGPPTSGPGHDPGKTSGRLAVVDHACGVPPPKSPDHPPLQRTACGRLTPGRGDTTGHPSPQPPGFPRGFPPHPPSLPPPGPPDAAPHLPAPGHAEHDARTDRQPRRRYASRHRNSRQPTSEWRFIGEAVSAVGRRIVGPWISNLCRRCIRCGRLHAWSVRIVQRSVPQTLHVAPNGKSFLGKDEFVPRDDMSQVAECHHHGFDDLPALRNCRPSQHPADRLRAGGCGQVFVAGYRVADLTQSWPMRLLVQVEHHSDEVPN